MNSWKFKNWCDAATDLIVFPPDREAVYAELMNHLYDHYDDLVEEGLEREAAEQMALTSMGSAAEIAPQLAAIHRPFWGYFLRATRVALVLAACAVVLCTWFWKRYVNDYSQSYEGWNYDPYTATQHEGMYTIQTRQHYWEVNQSEKSDGTTFTLTQAALWHVDYTNVENDDHDYDCFHFQIEAFNPLPWTGKSEAMDWLWGVDSLGNVYDSFHKGIINYAPYIWISTSHTGFLTYTHNMEINDYRSQDAEWIEFHYDRSGREMVFRIDLTGGEAA